MILRTSEMTFRQLLSVIFVILYFACGSKPLEKVEKVEEVEDPLQGSSAMYVISANLVEEVEVAQEVIAPVFKGKSKSLLDQLAALEKCVDQYAPDNFFLLEKNGQGFYIISGIVSGENKYISQVSDLNLNSDYQSGIITILERTNKGYSYSVQLVISGDNLEVNDIDIETKEIYETVIFVSESSLFSERKLKFSTISSEGEGIVIYMVDEKEQSVSFEGIKIEDFSMDNNPYFEKGEDGDIIIFSWILEKWFVVRSGNIGGEKEMGNEEDQQLVNMITGIWEEQILRFKYSENLCCGQFYVFENENGGTVDFEGIDGLELDNNPWFEADGEGGSQKKPTYSLKEGVADKWYVVKSEIEMEDLGGGDWGNIRIIKEIRERK